jgi:hypothetical protein
VIKRSYFILTVSHVRISGVEFAVGKTIYVFNRSIGEESGTRPIEKVIRSIPDYSDGVDVIPF